VKVLLQLQGQKQLGPGEKPKYSGGTDVVRQLYKEGGIRSVYRGSVMTLARDGPGSAVYFATYETIKRRLTPKDENGKPGKLSIPAVMAAGGAAGGSLSSLSTPSRAACRVPRETLPSPVRSSSCTLAEASRLSSLVWRRPWQEQFLRTLRLSWEWSSRIRL
jgi:hypothetical protein